MRFARGLAHLLLVTTALGCTGAGDEPPSPESAAAPNARMQSSMAESPLEGTQWRLVGMIGPGDSALGAPPADPAAFTVEFRDNGQMSIRLDCNSGTGTWSAVPDSVASTGELTFGPMAVTLAACPEPNLGSRLGREMNSVHRYALQDGHLRLSLENDAGTIIWEPDPDYAPVTGSNPDSAELR